MGVCDNGELLPHPAYQMPDRRQSISISVSSPPAFRRLVSYCLPEGSLLHLFFIFYGCRAESTLFTSLWFVLAHLPVSSSADMVQETVSVSKQLERLLLCLPLHPLMQRLTDGWLPSSAASPHSVHPARWM